MQNAHAVAGEANDFSKHAQDQERPGGCRMGAETAKGPEEEAAKPFVGSLVPGARNH